ncbi:MAG: SDR family oxidoreductase [Gammaproteobacteria bacterium]|nr:SDR family oxidoreductase [Gammaproteobacteria bacterium]
MKNFQNKIIVITGAASGMGAAYADEFAKLGARLALCDVNQEDLRSVSQRVADVIGPDNVYSEVVDVSDRHEVFSFADKVRSNLGNAHVIINNAGIAESSAPIYEMSIEQIEKVTRVNYFGVVYGTKAFLPQLVENNEGAVVNISSIFGLVAPPNTADYSATKFAVRGFTEALSVEFMQSPITIHCVHPGGIATNIAKNTDSEEFEKLFLTTPPHDIAKHVIKNIKKGKVKIVYGNQASKVWAISNLLPQKLVNSLLWKFMQDAIDTESYSKFIKK